MDEIKINKLPGGHTDWSALLDGEWRGLDFGGEPVPTGKVMAARNWAARNKLKLQVKTRDGATRARAITAQRWILEAGLRMGAPSAPAALEEYTAVWDTMGRKKLVLLPPEAMGLVKLLREVDDVFLYQEGRDGFSEWTDPGTNGRVGGIRERLENLLELKPGSLDTSRERK